MSEIKYDLYKILSNITTSLENLKSTQTSSLTLSITSIDNLILEAINIIKTIKTPIFQIKNDEDLKKIIDYLSKWILNNFSSILLSKILCLISEILFLCDYIKINPSYSYLISEAEAESKEEKTSQHNKDKEKTMIDDYLNKETVLTYQFLSALYVLIVSISNKPEILYKSKVLLSIISKLLYQICQIDNIVLYYKKKRLTSVFIKILNELYLKKDECLEVIKEVSIYYFYIYGYLLNKKPEYKGYLFKKGIPDVLSSIFLYVNKLDLIEINRNFIESYCYYLYFSSNTTHHRKFFWAKGVLNNLITSLTHYIELEELDNSISIIESIIYSIKEICFDTIECENELYENDFLETSKKIIKKYNKNETIMICILSIIRKTKENSYKIKLAEEFILTFLSMIDYYYIEFKEGKHKDKEVVTLVLVKNLIGIIGNFIILQKDFMCVIEKNFHFIIMDYLISFIYKPRLVKTCVGTLVNLSTNEDICVSLNKDPLFKRMIINTMDVYKENPFLIDYILRLLINICLKEELVYIEIYSYLIYYIKKYMSYEEIMYNSIRILRISSDYSNTYNDYILNIKLIYKTDFNSGIDGYLKDLIDLLEYYLNKVDIVIEILNVIGKLSLNSLEFNQIVHSKKEIFCVLNKVISNYNDCNGNGNGNGYDDNSNDKRRKKLLSQAIAMFPIEEIES